MTWVKLDDAFYDHPKVVKAGTRAIGLWATALGWANRHKSDGFVPKGIIRRLTDEGRPNAVVKRLVDAGLWHEVDGGFRIHDFDHYQPTRTEASAERSSLSEVRAEAGRLGARIREERRRAAASASVSAPCSDSDENAITFCDRTRSDSGQVSDADRVRIPDTGVQAKQAKNNDRNHSSASSQEKQTGSKPEAKRQANRKQTGSPDPDPVQRNPPHSPKGDEANEPKDKSNSSDFVLPATESGTFAVGQNRHDTGLEGNDGGIATVEYLPPLPAPLEAQQSTSVTTKFRDLGIRRFEATNIASAYASGIVEGRKQAGEAEPKYGVSAKHQRALDDAVDTHAPSQATKFAWLREAAFLFARYGFDGPSKILSYEPTAFAAWLNSGHYAKAKAKDAAEKSRQETTKLYLYTSRPKPPKTERLRTKIDQLRDHAKYCEEHNFVLTPDTSPENLRARANELEAELEELLQSEASEANHGT